MGSREKFGVPTSLPRHLNSRVPPGESYFKWRPSASNRVLRSFILFVNRKRSQIQTIVFSRHLRYSPGIKVITIYVLHSCSRSHRFLESISTFRRRLTVLRSYWQTCQPFPLLSSFTAYSSLLNTAILAYSQIGEVNQQNECSF